MERRRSTNLILKEASHRCDSRTLAHFQVSNRATEKLESAVAVQGKFIIIISRRIRLRERLFSFSAQSLCVRLASSFQ